MSATFKQKIQAGEIKRADAMKIKLDDIYEEPGFNAREHTPEFYEGIRQFAEYIAAGGTFPPIETRVRPEGGVFVVEGHRRRLALICARDELGAPVEWVNIIAFNGNDADRVARIVTSNSQVPLTTLETATVYKRLRNLGLDNTAIGKMVSKTPQHVAQLLLLADANTDVHKAVANGDVSAAVAVNLVREHGENAGKVIADELNKAKAAGKGKVTAGTVAGKSLPRKVVDEVEDGVKWFIAELPQDVLRQVALAGSKPEQHGDAPVTIAAGTLAELLRVHTMMTEAREQQAAKVREAEAKAAQTDIEDAA